MTPQLFSADVPLLIMAVFAGFIGGALVLLHLTVGQARRYGHGKSLRVFSFMFLGQLYAMARLRNSPEAEALLRRILPDLYRTLLSDWAFFALAILALFLVLRLFRLIRTPVFLLVCYSLLAGSACALVAFVMLA